MSDGVWEPPAMADLPPVEEDWRELLAEPAPAAAPAPPVAWRPASGSPSAQLDELHEAIRGCTACALHARRRQAVPGSGPVGARVMAVGEAPGEREDAQGVPFVGAAGQLLSKLLAAAGIPREELYITNTVRCRPPGNRDPQPEEVAACSHWLDATIDLIGPDVILILGRHALQRLLPDAGSISRLHGHRIRRGDRTYVPLYHPAAALYNGSMLRTLEDDMRQVRTYLDEAEEERRRAAEVPAASAAGDLQLTLF